MIDINAIHYDKDIYPRKQHSNKTVNDYAESILSGAKFPEIELQQVQYNGEVKNVLVDGWHRWKAYEQVSKQGDLFANADDFKSIGYVYWKPDEVIDSENVVNMLLLKLRAAEANKGHGDRLKTDEKRLLAEETAEKTPKEEITQKKIADSLGVTQKTISNWIAHIRGRQNAGRDATILRLSMLGWTQEEIGEKVGITKGRVSQVFNNIPISKIKQETQSFLEQGKSMEWIADHYSLDMPLLWATRLQEKSDLERMEEVNFPIRPYDVWNFANCHKLCGIDYPGRIPGQIVANVLYFYTQPGDLVIDPMAGGGTIIDVCLLMNRHCYGYDVSPTEERNDILHLDFAKELPAKSEKANLLFLDPPYFKKKEKEYPEGSISALNKQEYLKFFADMFSNTYQAMKEGSYLVLLMSNYDDTGNLDESIWIWDYVHLMTKAGWQVVREIQCPIPNQVIHPDTINKFTAGKKLARLGRSLIVTRK